MSQFQKYARKQKLSELRPYEEGEDVSGVSVGDEDKAKGSPKPGDMIARNPENHDDKWLVEAEYFSNNFEPSPVGDCED